MVDGSNIATEGRTLPSLAQLDEAVRAFMSERPHDLVTVIVDATFEHRIDKSEKQMYDEALSANELIVTPAGTIGRGDRFILEVAGRAGANVLSNDSFQEFHGEYDWLFEKGRLVGGRPVPGVGWVFVDRTPVRGPKSRQATRDAARKRGGGTKAATRPSKAASEPMPTPKAPPPGKKRAKKAASTAPAREKKAVADAIAAVVAAEQPSEAKAPKDPTAAKERGGRRRSSAKPQQPLNDQLPFIEFIAEHLPGSTVEGEVVEFSSHGAYVQVGAVRCYIPLRNMGDPAPRSAREVLERGQVRSFVVHSIEAARRGIDLALLDVPSAPEPLPAEEVIEPAADKAPSEDGAKQPESEATLAATKKAAGRKTAAKKTAARKSTAKKSTAKKSTARKATAKRSPAKKATARKSTARKSTAKKSTAKKSTARKSTAKKTTARKSTAKKTTARKSAKKSTAKKSTARKSTAKKATARKSTAKKSTAKKAGAKKAGAKKAGARKSTAKKSTARKSTAKKATARKSTAKKAGARKKTGARKTTARKR